MSGPKVVRIVTREELIAICEGHLARVEAAMIEWVRVARRNEIVTESEVAVTEARLTHLRQALKAGRFMDVQKQAIHEVAFLQDDQQARLAEVAAKAAAVRSTERRRADATRSLLATLRRSGTPLKPSLEAALERAAKGQADPAALAQGFALLGAPRDDSGQTRRALAQKLKDGDETRDLATWIAAQPKSANDLAFERLERRLAEYALVAGPEAASIYEARLAKAREEVNETRRGLLLDSLEMDLGPALAQAQRRAALTTSLQLALAELAHVDTVAHAGFLVRVNRVTDGEELADLLKEVQEAIVYRRNALAAAARRAAVLKGLAGLGYEVREGLATAWVDQGRVVLRKPAQPDYGVEISGDPVAARLQMRVVAFTDGTSGPDPVRDSDAETLWCGDVSVLQAQLAETGGALVIERALPIGAAPLKRVLDIERGHTAARQGPALRSRTLG